MTHAILSKPWLAAIRERIDSGGGTIRLAAAGPSDTAFESERPVSIVSLPLETVQVFLRLEFGLPLERDASDEGTAEVERTLDGQSVTLSYDGDQTITASLADPEVA